MSSCDVAPLSQSQIESLVHADAYHHWHGFTQMADYDSLLIERGDGNWLVDIHGRRLLDGIGSMWCNVHGHGHPRINQAIADQLAKISHVTALGMGGVPTAELSRRLAEILPGELNHVFYSSDGAAAIEAAIKLALQYWHLRADRERQPQLASKTRYLALGSAYHGDTTGAVALGDIAHFHQMFQPLLFSALRGPFPDLYRLPPTVARQAATEHYADQLDRLIAQHADQLAAVIVEPLVQGAAGMVVHPAGLLARVRQACDRHQVLLIADEVATGFGRTGQMFACQHEAVTPDIICLGKGLTGGYLPMAAAVASTPIWEVFLAPRAAGRQFFHGHTYGGNPLAAAAALASLDLFEQESTLENVRQRSAQLAQGLAELADHRHVGDIRQCGLMAGIELVADRENKTRFDAGDQVGHRVCRAASECGVLVRPLDDVVVLVPPLSITAAEIDQLVAAVRFGIQTILGT